MNLLRAEWSRLFARRFTKIMFLVILAVIAVIAVGFAYTSHQHNAAAWAQATAQVRQIRAHNEQEQHKCEAAQQSNKENGGSENDYYPPDMDCSALTRHAPSPEVFLPDQFVFRTDIGETVSLFGFLLALFGFAVGASFVGAEWSSAGMMNLLLWRPKRLPLLAGKLTALLLGVLTTSAVLSLAWYGAMWSAAKLRGDASGITAGQWRSLALTDVRALVMAMAAAALGFCIASLGRHTATALGIIVGYAVVFEFGTRLILHQAQTAKPERFLLSSYVSAWLRDGARYVYYPPCRPTGPDMIVNCDGIHWSISMDRGALICGVGLAVVAFLSFLRFRRRDI